MNKKSVYLKLLPVILCATLLSACNGNSTLQKNIGAQTSSQSKQINSVSVNAGAVKSEMITYDREDYYSDWKNENPNYIELSGTKATVKGSGAEVKGSKITITTAGVYAFSGKLDNGQIIVDVQNKGIVKLVLNGAEINCSDSSAIYVKNAGKTIISLQEGTQNSVTDGKKYASSGASEDEPTAAIFSKDNLTINGTGKLTVRGNYKDGITSKDDLKITGGTININSADDGLVGRDMLLVKEGNITIDAVGDGIKSTNDTDASKGFIALGGGTFDIKSGMDGIQAETSALISGGKFTIVTGGGSAKAPVKSGDNGPGGQMGRPGTQQTAKTTTTEQDSKKSIKVSSDITISGGTLSIDSYDDSIHSNNSVNITGGDISITAGDDGIHGDTAVTIKDGKINIKKSYEGIESSLITIAGGETHLVSSDDGVNASGGNSGASMGGPGQNTVNPNASNKLIITGGYLSVDALGDGLDSNGYAAMSGGTVVVSGPTENMNGALDYDEGFDMTGGFLIAAGSSGMAMAPSDQSKQYSIGMYYSSVQKAGTIVILKDSSGNTIATYAPNKDYQSVVISSPELKKDAEYTLYTGGTSTGTLSDGFYSKGENKGGNKVVSFKISNSVTWLNESGVTTNKGNGMGGPGGGQRGFGGKNQGGQQGNSQGGPQGGQTNGNR